MSDVVGFGLAAKEAIAALKGKIPQGTQRWDDLAGPAHGKLFAVAGAVSTDLVGELHAAVTRALEEGQTLSAFRKDFDEAVAKHGWTYRGSRGWRTQLIYSVNMRSAHMAGRWQQLQEGKTRRPYLQYRTAGDARVRPEHRQWNGIVRHIDDPFWLTHYPPCGWNCRCTVRAYSEAEVQALGLQVDKDPYPIKWRDVVVDGEVVDRVPVGIDPGWDHNVGMSWLQPELSLGRKIVSLPRELRGPVADKTITPQFQAVLSERWKAFRSARKDDPLGRSQVLGFLDSATMDALADEVPSVVMRSSAISGFDSKLTHLSGRHKAQAKPDQVWPDEWIDAIPQHLRDYRAVLWDRDKEALVIVPRDSFNDRLPKLVLKQERGRNGYVWSVVSLGSAQAANLLEEAGYQLLLGRLK